MENLHEHFGLAIKNARLDCGLTQEALAERAGIGCRSHAAGTMNKASQRTASSEVGISP